jgi:diguanylate cyclase (GGDEF)-like protein
MSSAFGVTALSPRLDAAMALLELSAIFLVGWQGWSFISPHFLQTWCVLMTGLVMLRLVTSRLTVNGSRGVSVGGFGWVAAIKKRRSSYAVMGLNLGWTGLAFFFIYGGRGLSGHDLSGQGLTPAFLILVLSCVLLDRAVLEINQRSNQLTPFCLFSGIPFAVVLLIVGGFEARASAIAFVALCWAARMIVSFYHSEISKDAEVEAEYSEARREAGNLAFLAAASEETLQAVMNNVTCGIAICDKNLRFSEWNDSYVNLMDMPLKWMSTSRTFLDLAHLHAEQGEYSEADLPLLLLERKEQFANVLETGVFETEIQRPSGAVYLSRWVRLPGDRVMFIHTDISEGKKVTADAMVHLSQHDLLTGLPNRAKFRRELEKALNHARRAKTQVSVMVLNLDRFKDINDAIGHPAGDELLCILARRLESCARKSDFAARLGADEFAIIGTGHENVDEAVLMAKRLLKAVATRVELGAKVVNVSASIGITTYPDDNSRADQLVRNAELALFRAKQDGRSHYQLYDESMHSEIKARADLERDLRAAQENNDFIFHYQPQIDLKTKQVTGLEALMRWHHAERGWVPPDQFIAAAEAANLIIPMTESLLPAACDVARKLQAHGFKPLTVAVNLSPLHFKSDGIVKFISEVLAQSGLDAEFLELEITEGMVMQDSEQVIKTLMQLDQLGVKLAIDDFGTGYSSLSYLKKFPVDKLKIDQSFVRDVPHDPGAAAIVEAVIKLGHSFNLKVIAEGVETREQIEFLEAMGCDEVQGYYFSKARPVDELVLWLEDWHVIEPSIERAVG